MDTQTSYRIITSNMTRTIERVSKEPINSRETEYFRQNIGKVKNVSEFMADSRLYNYALKAFGLSDMSYAKAFVRKVLTEGVESTDAMARKLVDKRYLEFATAFDFAGKGEKVFETEKSKQAVIDKYMRQSIEAEAGAENEGVRLALYFERKAPKLKNVYEILGDKALLTVVQKAFGWPPEMSRMDIDKQAKLIEGKIDLKKLSEPDYLGKFLTRFMALYDISRPDIQKPASVASLLLGGTSTIGISDSILTTLQRFKPGGF